MGGAVLGTYPQIAYDEVLQRISDYGSLVIVATPYDLETDHRGVCAQAPSLHEVSVLEFFMTLLPQRIAWLVTLGELTSVLLLHRLALVLATTGISERCKAMFDRAVESVGKTYTGPLDNLPLYGIGHSLGAKVQVCLDQIHISICQP